MSQPSSQSLTEMLDEVQSLFQRILGVQQEEFRREINTAIDEVEKKHAEHLSEVQEEIDELKSSTKESLNGLQEDITQLEGSFQELSEQVETTKKELRKGYKKEVKKLVDELFRALERSNI